MTPYSPFPDELDVLRRARALRAAYFASLVKKLFARKPATAPAKPRGTAGAAA